MAVKAKTKTRKKKYERHLPTKYETHVKPRLKSVEAWRRKGLTCRQIGDNLSISHTAFARYQRDHPEFAAALFIGKLDADATVENALFRRAVGYEYTETKRKYEPSMIFNPNEPDTPPQPGPPVLVSEEILEKKKAPDVVAQIFYLKNRVSRDWHDRHGIEHSGPGGMPISPGSVQIFIPDNGRGDAQPPPNILAQLKVDQDDQNNKDDQNNNDEPADDDNTE